MPKGVYRKKDKKGRWMHFRDGKIISKDSFTRSKAARKNGTKKGQVRKTARRAYTKPKNNNRSNKKMKGIPHPSLTGLASGMAIAAYLNSATSEFRSGGRGTKIVGEGVIKDITDGQLGQAFGTLAGNAVNMITSDTGRKVLVGSSLIALAGAFARSRFPRLKLGGERIYFRL